MKITQSDFLIRDPNIHKAVSAIRALDLPGALDFSPELNDIDVIGRTLGFFGFRLGDHPDGLTICGETMPALGGATLALLEEIFKAVSRAVEPGSFLEFSGSGTLFRYVFLFDTVERWSVPHTLFRKKEAI